MKLSSILLTSAALLLSPVLSQTFTNCNPLNTTCPADPALGVQHTFNFNTSTPVDQAFNVTGGTMNYGSNGAEFTIKEKGDSPTIISQFYIFWGSVSVIMQAAEGTGIVSSIVLLSDDLDEVDWEFMGGNSSFAETNYFGKDNTTSFDRAIYYPVSSDVRKNFHNYTVHWTSSLLQWYIDGNLVRTLPYAAANGGNNYPQTPMTVRMGIWAGGDASEPEGTRQWAGGLTDYGQGPFTMFVQSATVNDFSTGKEYVYSDNTGSWQSIKTVSGNSTVAKTITAPPPLSFAQKWNNLPSGTKLGIYCAAGGAGALLLAAMLFTCVRQRRKGRQERDLYNAKVEKEREDAYRDQIQLREKGLGGWDTKEFNSQGEDALGGWGGGNLPMGSKGLDEGPALVPESPMSPIQRPPTTGSVRSPGGMNQMPARSNTPGGYQRENPNFQNMNAAGFRGNSPAFRSDSPGFRSDSPGLRSASPAIRSNTPAVSRMMSPAPSLAAPQPQRTWNGSPQGAMNPEITSYGSPRSPTLPIIGRGPSRGGFNSGGYQRF